MISFTSLLIASEDDIITLTLETEFLHRYETQNDTFVYYGAAMLFCILESNKFANIHVQSDQSLTMTAI